MPPAVNLNSDVLQLQTLNEQYMAKLTEYKTAFATYVTTIQSQTIANSFVIFPGKKFMGTASLSDNNNSTAEQCVAMCSSNTDCTGATFNNTTKVCKLIKGDGVISLFSIYISKNLFMN